MTTLAEYIIVAGAENRPPMLEKSMYDSWSSRIHLFIKGKKHGRMMLDSIDNDDCDVQATNIILHGLPTDVYALVNHQEAAKDIWDRVKMLMKGTELLYQDRECRLYNLFDKFAYVQGETLYEYYWRFSQLINDMHAIGMTMQQVQVNTKFMNALSSKWSKFVTNVKLASRFPSSNNQLRTSSNPRNQATIQDGRVAVQRVQERQNQSYVGTGNKGIATTCHTLRENLQWSSRSPYPGISEAPVAPQTIPQNLAFQTKDLDTYDSDCNDLSSAKAVLMANLSSCDPEVLSEVPYSDSYLNDMINQDVNEM
ncbi:hypothetical protein Tco_1290472 [Tanacetum coccineum]